MAEESTTETERQVLEARIRKLENRNEDYLSAIEESVEILSDSKLHNGYVDEHTAEEAIAKLRRVSENG